MRVVATAGALVLLACSCRRAAPPNFETTLVEIDGALLSGGTASVGAMISSAADAAAGRDQWARLAKRAFVLAEMTDSWTPLSSVAEAATRAFPGVEEFSVILAFAARNQGEIERAYEISRDYLRSDAFAHLSNLIWFEAGAAGVHDRGVPGYEVALESGIADAFLEAGERLDEPEFFLNAALVQSYLGEIDSSSNYLRRFLDAYPTPAGYLLFDQNRFSEAADSILRAIAVAVDSSFRTDVRALSPQGLKRLVGSATADSEMGIDLLLLLDSLALADLHDAYEAAATEVVLRLPGLSPVPYQNLVRLALARGELIEAGAYLNEGLSRFPEDADLNVLRIRLAIRRSGPQVAKELIREIRERIGTTFDLELLELETFPSEAAHIRFETASKELFYADPGDVRIAKRLAATYFAARRFSELGALLDEHERAAGRAHWSMFYRAAIAVDEYDFALAESLFESIDEPTEWSHRFNVALVMMATQRYEEAKEVLRSTSTRVDDPSVKAVLALQTARALRALSDRQGAIREASFALGLDPTLTAARLLLVQLESATQ